MKLYKISLIFLIIFILSIGSAYASDLTDDSDLAIAEINNGLDDIAHSNINTEDIDLELSNPNSLELDNVKSIEIADCNNDTIQDNKPNSPENAKDNNPLKNLLKENELNAESSSEDAKSFSDLNKLILESSEINITNDYAFNPETDNDFIEGIKLYKKDITINGNKHIIDAKGQSRIFKLFDTGITINNLTLMNAKDSAIYSEWSDISTSNMVFKNNLAEKGGAIQGYSTTYNSQNDKFINNYAYKGAAIYLSYADGEESEDYASELNLINGSFESEKQLSWGLIYSNTCKLNIIDTVFANISSNYSTAIQGEMSGGIIKNCKFINLYANMSAGAIALRENLKLFTIEDSIFTNVSSRKNGGALFYEIENNEEKTIKIKNSRFSNCSSEFGGAIMNLGFFASITNCNFTDNHAKYCGGAIYASNTLEIAIDKCNFYNNSLTNISKELNQGSAIFAQELEYIIIQNSNFTDNLAEYAQAIYLYETKYKIVNSQFNGNVENIATFNDLEKSIHTNNTYIDGKNRYNRTSCLYVLEGEPINIEFNPITIDESLAKESYFNLADYGIKTSIKNQISTNACWAFGTATALELALIKATGGALKANISVNDILYYGNGYSTTGEQFNYDEGDYYKGSSYFLNWIGGFLNEDESFDELQKISIREKNGNKFHLQNFIAFPTMDVAKDRNVYKEALVKYGALGITLNSPNSEINDDYNNETYGAYYYIEPDSFEGSAANHAVILVGWNDSYSKENFIKTPPGDGAWIIQNSYGDKWGDGGYYYVSYYDTAFATLSSPIAFIINESYPYEKNYEYDISLTEFNREFTEDYEGIAYANVYESTGNDLISAVGTYFNESGMDYAIIISVNGEEVHSQKGVSLYKGYQTIKLDKSIAVMKGDEFRIEIQSRFIPKTFARGKFSKTISYINRGSGFEACEADETACIKAYAISNPMALENLVKYYADESPLAISVGANEDISFEINGIKASSKSDENGTLKIGIDLKPGKYPLTVEYNGTKITYLVTIKSTIVTNNVTRGYNSNFLYKIKLLDSTGRPIKNAKTTISVNGKAKTYTTNSTGYISILFSKLQENKTISIVNPATNETAKYGIKVVSRFSANKNVNMYYFDGSKFTAKVYSYAGKLVGAGQIVRININKKTYKVKTNKNGVVSFKIPKTVLPGTYTLTASYAGQSVKNTVKVKQVLSSKSQTIKRTAKKMILSASMKNKLKGKKISFKLNGKTYSAKTNSKGIAKITLNKNVIKKLKLNKNYSVKITYLLDSVKVNLKVKR